MNRLNKKQLTLNLNNTMLNEDSIDIDKEKEDITIISDTIYLSSGYRVKTKEGIEELKSMGVTIIVSVVEEIDEKEYKIDDSFNIVQKFIFIPDKPTEDVDLEKGLYDFFDVIDHMKDNDKIYIHCKEGISRSPTFVAGYYIHYFKMTDRDAVHKLRHMRRVTNIIPMYLFKLYNFYNKNH